MPPTTSFMRVRDEQLLEQLGLTESKVGAERGSALFVGVGIEVGRDVGEEVGCDVDEGVGVAVDVEVGDSSSEGM